MFYMKDTKNMYVILHLYVDDMLIVGNNEYVIKTTKKLLNSQFDMKDMRLAVLILINIIKTYDGLILSQSHYVDKILRKFNKKDFGVARTPIDNGLHL